MKPEFIRVVHFFDKHFPDMGGCTVAYYPEVHDSAGFPQGKFARVAVAWCKPGDRYSRTRGQEIATYNLLEGECVLMPIYQFKHPVKALRAVFSDQLLEHNYLDF